MEQLGQLSVKQRIQIPAMLIWLVAALGVPYQFMLQSTPNVMIPMLMHVFHIDEAGIGFVTSGFFYTYLFFQIPAGMLVDRYGARVVLSTSILLAGLASLLFAFSTSYSLAVTSRLVMGLASAPCVPAIMYVAARRFSPSRFVILAGMAESIGMMGGAVGDAVLGEVVTHSGWQQTMIGCGVLGIFVAVLMYAVIRDQPTETYLTTSSGNNFKAILSGFSEVMKSSQVWLIAVYGGLIFALLPALAGLWIVQTLQDLYHVSLEIAALGSAALFAGTSFGLPFWGWLSERMGRRRPALFIASGINILLTSSFVYMQNQPLVLVFIQLLLMGFVSAIYVLAFALVRENTPERVRASAMGLTNMMSMILGALLLQPLIGALLEYFHVNGHHTKMSLQQVGIAYSYSLSSVVICLVLAFVLIFFIRETHCTQQVTD